MGVARIYALSGNPLLAAAVRSEQLDQNARENLNPAHITPVAGGHFVALSNEDQQLVDHQVEKLLHAAWDGMGRTDAPAPLHYQGVSFHFGVSEAMQSALKSGTIGLYVATYVNNMRESIAQDTRGLAGLREMEEIASAHGHAKNGTAH